MADFGRAPRMSTRQPPPQPQFCSFLSPLCFREYMRAPPFFTSPRPVQLPSCAYSFIPSIRLRLRPPLLLCRSLLQPDGSSTIRFRFYSAWTINRPLLISPACYIHPSTLKICIPSTEPKNKSARKILHPCSFPSPSRALFFLLSTLSLSLYSLLMFSVP
jgi:hypothetical protein